jgi:hypothetical protein
VVYLSDRDCVLVKIFKVKFKFDTLSKLDLLGSFSLYIHARTREGREEIKFLKGSKQ